MYLPRRGEFSLLLSGLGLCLKDMRDVCIKRDKLSQFVIDAIPCVVSMLVYINTASVVKRRDPGGRVPSFSSSVTI